VNDERLIAFGRCWSCRRSFAFDPDLVPSIPIDPETDSPLDVNPDGSLREFSADEYARSVKRPICEDCVDLANAERAKNGRPLIVVYDDAYP
jgi:hypothetical protein